MTISRQHNATRNSSRWVGRTVIAVVAIGVLFAGSIVGSAAAAPDGLTAGRIPNDAIRSDGSTDYNKIPDLIAALDRNGNQVGFVSKTDLFPELRGEDKGDSPIAVVDLSGKQIGLMVPDVGFVTNGQVVHDWDKARVETYEIP